MIHAFGIAKYFGSSRALGPVSFEIGRSETVGFLGLNGAGKTTILRILAGELRPSAGTLLVDGVDAVTDPLAVRRLVGYLPEHPPLYPDMRVSDFLRFAARIRGLDASTAARRVAEVEEWIGLEVVQDELVRHLSQGYRQRVGLAQAIIHTPALLILDEPSHDLDPAQIVELRERLVALKSQHTILVSSHNLTEISQTCDRLLMLDRGEIVASGTEENLSARWLDAQRVEVTISTRENGARDLTADGAEDTDPVAAAMAALREIDTVRDVTITGADQDVTVLLVESSKDRRAEVCRLLVERGYDVLQLERRQHRLETVFLGILGETRHGRDHGHLAT